MYQNRDIFIKDLNSFISSARNQFNTVLQSLNWTEESLTSSLVLNSNHGSSNDEVVPTVILEQSSDKGESCAQGQVLDILNGNRHESKTLYPFELCLGIENQTSDGSVHLYDDIVGSIQVLDQSSKSEKKNDIKNDAASLAQLLMTERDSKRRRTNYKNKVHTKNKSHMEVLREVVNEQMLTLSAGLEDAPNQILPQPQQELIAIRPLPGNPHLAWVAVLEDDKASTRSPDSKLSHRHGSGNSHLNRDNKRHKDRREKYSPEHDSRRDYRSHGLDHNNKKIKREGDNKLTERDDRIDKKIKDSRHRSKSPDVYYKKHKKSSRSPISHKSHKKRSRKRSRSKSPVSQTPPIKKHNKKRSRSKSPDEDNDISRKRGTRSPDSLSPDSRKRRKHKHKKNKR